VIFAIDFNGKFIVNAKLQDWLVILVNGILLGVVGLHTHVLVKFGLWI